MSLRPFGTVGSSVTLICAFALGCGGGETNSLKLDGASSGGAGGQHGGIGGTTEVIGTGGRNGEGGTNGTTTGGTASTGGATGSGGATTDAGGAAGTGSATRTGGAPGFGGGVGTGGRLLGGAGGTGAGGTAGGSCVAPPTNGACSRDGDLFCGGTACCPSADPYFCPATNYCYPTALQAASACGSTGCFGCVAPVTGTCSAAPAGGACNGAEKVYCGGNCCASEYPYFCPTKNLCYASSNQAVAACGGDSCLACAPTCSAPPNVTASEVSDGICGGAPLAVIDGIPAFAMCDAALKSNVWTSTGADTAGVSEGPGWVETGVGRITGENGYQCVELTQRYFYFRFGICPWAWVAAKDMCTGALPPTIVITTTPVHGDLIVITPGCDGAGLATGHVAVVDSVSGSTVTAVQQNAGTNGRGTFHINCAICFLHAVANDAGP